MGIHIDSISRREFGRHFSWHLRAKGLEGQGVYFSCWTGSDGAGLFGYSDMGMVIQEWFAPDRFVVHARWSAEQVVHRVVTALVMMGRGPEAIDDRDAVSGGRRFEWKVVVTDRTL